MFLLDLDNLPVLRLFKQKHIITAIRAAISSKTAIPPTAPPIIAMICVSNRKRKMTQIFQCTKHLLVFSVGTEL